MGPSDNFVMGLDRSLKLNLPCGPASTGRLSWQKKPDSGATANPSQLAPRYIGAVWKLRVPIDGIRLPPCGGFSLRPPTCDCRLSMEESSCGFQVGPRACPYLMPCRCMTWFLIGETTKPTKAPSKRWGEMDCPFSFVLSFDPPAPISGFNR